MKHKTAKNLWIIIALLAVAAMVVFTVMPAFMF
jgi:hypothetical protein